MKTSLAHPPCCPGYRLPRQGHTLCKPTSSTSLKVVERSDAASSPFGRAFPVGAQCTHCLHPDPGSLVLPRRAPALQPLLDSEAAIALPPDKGHASLLQQNTRSSQRYQKAAGAASAKRCPRNKRDRGRQGHKKLKPEDKWAWAGSSFELNLSLPEIQQSTKLIYVNRPGNLSNPPCSIQALLLAPLEVIQGSGVADLVCGFLTAIPRLTSRQQQDIIFYLNMVRNHPCGQPPLPAEQQWHL